MFSTCWLIKYPNQIAFHLVHTLNPNRTIIAQDQTMWSRIGTFLLENQHVSEACAISSIPVQHLNSIQTLSIFNFRYASSKESFLVSKSGPLHERELSRTSHTQYQFRSTSTAICANGCWMCESFSYTFKHPISDKLKKSLTSYLMIFDKFKKHVHHPAISPQKHHFFTKRLGPESCLRRRFPTIWPAPVTK